MLGWEVLSPAATLLAAGLGAASGAWLQHHFSRKRDHLEIKRGVLRRVIGYRWQLTAGRAHPDGAVFTALNEIPVVFAGDKDVETAVAAFRKAVNESPGPRTFTPLYKPWRSQPGFHTRA